MTLTYDGADRMVQGDSSAGTITYSYAGTDSSEIVKIVTASGSTYTYTYGRTDRNGLPLLESFTKKGSQYGIDYDPDGTPIAMTLPSGTHHFFALDGQGTSEALVQGDGTESGSYTYDPYGNVLNATGPGNAVNANVYRHQMGFIDDNVGGTGWTKHGIRWNDNSTGTWTTQDPLSFVLDPQQGNRYLFAGGDPINNSDPVGLSCLVDALKAGAAGFIGGLVTGVGAPEGAVGAFVGVGAVCETQAALDYYF